MGRPLSKKYFGNRNIGTGGDQTTGNLSNSQNYGDDRIGGEGVASVTINTEGTYTAGLPTATFSTPDLPGGVRATGTVHGHALSAATTANGTGYRVGDVLTVTGGTKTSAATFPVASIVTLGTPSITNGGSLYDVTNGSEGDRVTFTHSNLSTPLRVRVTGVSGSTVTSIVVEQAGVWTGSGAFPTSMAGGVGGFTATTTARAGGDNNGTGLVLGFSGSNWGVYAFGDVAVQGDYTVAAGNPASFSGGNGTGAAATITYGVSGIAVTEKGSGYTTVADAAITFSGGAAAATPVLTTDSGVPYSAGNQENAIICFAKTTSGGSNLIGDIIKQQGKSRYKVKTADGIAYCNLKTTGAASAEGEMTITATDSTGKTYYVSKLTAHRATIVPYGSAGHTFPLVGGEPQSVHWTFSDSDGSYNFATSVVVANA